MRNLVTFTSWTCLYDNDDAGTHSRLIRSYILDIKVPGRLWVKCGGSVSNCGISDSFVHAWFVFSVWRGVCLYSECFETERDKNRLFCFSFWKAYTLTSSLQHRVCTLVKLMNCESAFAFGVKSVQIICPGQNSSKLCKTQSTHIL